MSLRCVALAAAVAAAGCTESPAYFPPCVNPDDPCALDAGAEGGDGGDAAEAGVAGDASEGGAHQDAKRGGRAAD